VCAPSGGNRQTWRFLVIRDPALRARIGALYGEAFFQDLMKIPYDRSVDRIKAPLTEHPFSAPHPGLLPPPLPRAQSGQPACHGIFCRNRTPVQRDAPPQDACGQTPAIAASG
jgi:nitroreductase